VCRVADQTDIVGSYLPTSSTAPTSNEEVRNHLKDGDRYIQTTCPPKEGESAETVTGVWVRPGQATSSPGPTPAEFEAAVKEMVLPGPVVTMWPAADRMVVGVETWLHVDSSDPVRPIPFGAALVDGVETRNVKVAASATVTSVEWSFGAGTMPVTCDGAGQVWSPGADERDPHRCVVRFHRSGGGSATVTLQYRIGWQATTGQGGTVVTERSATVPYQVRGYEAVIR
jgi:hypothetical protein